MKYLLCHTYHVEEDGKSFTKVEEEELDDFGKAVIRYTLMCGASENVVLADLENEKIIRQYAHRSSCFYEGGTSDAICIY